VLKKTAADAGADDATCAGLGKTRQSSMFLSKQRSEGQCSAVPCRAVP
jgi:hypothetical protein